MWRQTSAFILTYTGGLDKQRLVSMLYLGSERL